MHSVCHAVFGCPQFSRAQGEGGFLTQAGLRAWGGDIGNGAGEGISATRTMRMASTAPPRNTHTLQS